MAQRFLMAFAVDCLFVWFVVPVVGVYDVREFAETVFGVREHDFELEEVRVRTVGRGFGVLVGVFCGHCGWWREGGGGGRARGVGVDGGSFFLDVELVSGRLGVRD